MAQRHTFTLTDSYTITDADGIVVGCTYVRPFYATAAKNIDKNIYMPLNHTWELGNTVYVRYVDIVWWANEYKHYNNNRHAKHEYVCIDI